MIKYELKGQINTNQNGINKLLEFYYYLSHYNNESVEICFKKVRWFDANLCALFGSIIFLLENENNLNFHTSIEYIKENFDVLYRNGFFDNGINKSCIDERESTVEYKSFSITDDVGYAKYIDEKLLCHRGMPVRESEIVDKIRSSLLELFCNIEEHSNNNYKCFTCGQYYPIDGSFVFSVVDLGEGFLKNVKKKEPRINDSHSAINWAIKKNNTSKTTLGGLGLYYLDKFIVENNGDLHIITDNTFWSKKGVNRKNLKVNTTYNTIGTTINLVINCK